MNQPRFVRQFVLTRGRSRSVGADLALDTLVTLTDAGRRRAAGGELRAEAAAIARLLDGPLSVAEIGAHLHVHLGIARVLVSDLVADGVAAVSAADFDETGPDLGTLERLLDDLQAL
ncbi:MAG: DUF742 domain-containing protein [Acidimicrobiia bacterium]